VFFPAYNAEVIVVNDGSRDQTAEVLDRSRQRHGEAFRVITHRVNCGYGVALGSGFAAARKEFVFCTVGDGQYDIRELPILLDRMAPDLGTVNGFNLERNDPWQRIAIGNIYNRFARLVFRIGIRDIDSDFRLIRRALLEPLRLTSTSGTI
jgi:glycosyltransferase involved in cell wall biosynthesis